MWQRLHGVWFGLLLAVVLAAYAWFRHSHEPAMVTEVQLPRTEKGPAGTIPPASTASATGTVPPAATLPAAEVISKYFADLEAQPGVRAIPDSFSLHGMHQKFMSEKVDPNWSSNVEAGLQGNFAPQFDPKDIQVVNMECRATMCEITAVGAEGKSVVRDWQNAVLELSAKDWSATESLEHTTTTFSTTPDGRVIMVSYFTKASTPR